MRQKTGYNRIPFLFCYAALIMLLCCGFSPLLRFYSTDGSVFYSVGKAMVGGQVVYRDIFDHKGLWLYFFEYIAASVDAYIGAGGVWLLETAFFFVNLLTVRKTAALFIEDGRSALLTALLLGGFSLNYFSYAGGNFAETYALTFQLLGAYLIAKAYTQYESATAQPLGYMLLHGIFSGICLYLRMNLVAMWIPYGAIFSVQLLREKKPIRLLQNYAALLLGVLLVTLPVAAYALVNDCVEELLFCMLTFNLSYVGDGGSAAAFLREFFSGGAYAVFLCALLSTGVVLKSKRLSKVLKAVFVSCLLCTVYFTFMGLRAYGHYFETLFPFLLPMFVLIGEKLPGRILEKKRARVLAVVCCALLTLLGNMRLVIRYAPVDTAYKELYSVIDSCREQINGDALRGTLLTTGNYMQPYVILDAYPAAKYPYLPGSSYEVFPEPSDEMYREILSGMHQYIFGADYFGGCWCIFDGAQQAAVNDFIARNYTPVSVSETHGFVMFMKNTEAQK